MKKYYFEIFSSEKEIIDQFTDEKINYTIHYIIGPYENKISEKMHEVFSDEITKESFLLYLLIKEEDKEKLIPLYCFSEYDQNKIDNVFSSIVENGHFVVNEKTIDLSIKNIDKSKIRSFGIKKFFSILKN